MDISREAIICSGRHLAAANEITLGKKPAGFGGVCTQSGSHSRQRTSGRLRQRGERPSERRTGPVVR